MIINKDGKTKQQLLMCLEKFKEDFKYQINENDVRIDRIQDGFIVDAKREIFFIKFWVKAKIIAKDNALDLTWETNAPESKVKDALEKIVNVLEKC